MKAKQLFGSKPMSRRRQLSLARSAITKKVIDGDESERNVDSPKKVQVCFLCSAVYSPLDLSKRFTLFCV